MEKRGTVYIVDTENKHNTIMEELRNAGEMDDIILFEVGSDPKISLKLLTKLLDCKARVIFERGFNGTPNALDMQISSLLGFFVACNKYERYVVVSGDNGFVRLADYWKNHGVPVHICDSIGVNVERIMSPTGIRTACIEPYTRIGCEEASSVQELRDLNIAKIGVLCGMTGGNSTDSCTSEESDLGLVSETATSVSSDIRPVTDENSVYSESDSANYVAWRNIVHNEELMQDSILPCMGITDKEEKPQATKLLRKFPNVKDTKSEYERAVSRLLGATIKPEAKQFVDMLDELVYIHHAEEQASNYDLFLNCPICKDGEIGKVVMNTLATLLLCTKDEEEFCKVATQAFKYGVIKQYGLNTAVDWSMFLSKITQWAKKTKHNSLGMLAFSEDKEVEE